MDTFDLHQEWKNDEEVGKNSDDEGRGPKEEAPKEEAPAELAELQRRMNARNRFLALLFEAWRRATCVGPSGTCGSSDATSGSSSTGSLHIAVAYFQVEIPIPAGRYPLVPPPLPPPGLGWEPRPSDEVDDGWDYDYLDRAPDQEWPDTDDGF